MPSFCHFGALLALAAVLSSPSSSQLFAQQKSENKSASTSARSSAQVQHVVVRGTGNAMEVEIQTSGAPLAPDTQAITGPDRIVVDFPGAIPAAELRALKVNSGALKGVRAGLFFSNPPITRVVLDLAEPQSYQISTTQISKGQNVVVVKLSSEKLSSEKLSPEKLTSAQVNPAPSHLSTAAWAKTPRGSTAPAAKLQNVSLASGSPGTSMNGVGGARMSSAVANTTSIAASESEAPAPPKPNVVVSFTNGLLRIQAEKATLAQVLFEVQRQTQAEIAIPAGAEQEEVAADLGPAPARDVLGSLLNGSPYNFIFIGNELNLQKVILSRRDASIF
jgi:hypothetical protein